MNSAHFILQGKGGVGKSLIAALLAQYFHSKVGEDLLCADTDSVNDTFARYAFLKAVKINIINGDSNIDARAFDSLIEMLLEHKGVSVIDNGASTFVPLTGYLKENSVINLLKEAGKEVYIHTVLTGGQAMQDTLVGLQTLLNHQSAPIIVWQNEFFGDVTKQGKNFLSSALYQQNTDRIKAVLTIPRRNPDTFGKDIEKMVSEKLTFEEALNSDKFTVMPKQRLKVMRAAIFDQILNAGF